MLKNAVFVLIGLLLVSQFVRPARSNPTIDSAKTLEASAHPPPEVVASLDRACRDCHSSETNWPWYTNVAPISWWIVHHVNEGRGEVSLSTWADLTPQRKAKKLEEICEQVQQKKMPTTSYLLIHREAALNDTDRQAICNWTKTERAKLGPLPPASHRHRN